MTALARPPRTVELEATCTGDQLHTTIDEHGFAQTISSGGGDPRALPKELHWRSPTDEHPTLKVRGLLGQGGMSSVLLVEQPALNREVAVKVPRGSDGSEMIVTEARLNGLVEHPGVIPVYALVSDDQGQPALVMRKVDAVSWRALLERREHPLWRQLETTGDRLSAHVRLLLQLCNTLAYAHSRGVIHRDLKPENVLIGSFGEIFLADWGVATRVNDQHPEFLVGTAAYLAPEMARGEPVDERTDVFLIGSTLYELLSGATPWRGPSLVAALRMAATGRPAPLPPSVPSELSAICQKAMAPARGDRYASALEVKHALEQWLHHRASQAISDETERKLDELATATREKAPSERVYRLLAECRFGFSLALRDWAGNQSASHGLERAILLVAGYELAQGHADAARALVAELKKPPDELERAIADLARTQAESAAHLKALVTDVDPKTDARRRTVVTLLLATGLSGFIVAGLVWPGLFDGRWSLVFANLAFDAVVAATFAAARLDPMRLTWLNRSALGSIVVMAAGAFVFRAVAASLEVPHLATLSLELLAFAMVATVLGVTLHRGFFLAALGTSVTVAAMHLVGLAPLELYTAGLTFSIASAGWALRGGKGVLLSGMERRD